MERYDQRHDDELIDLGSVTESTKGALVNGDDQHLGKLIGGGISDD